MASNPRNVRQRTDNETSHISDLPNGFLANVSEYLSNPSKAMFAIALSAPSSSWNVNSIPSNVSKAIVSSQQWDVLDFEEVNTELANKLTDDDISAILTCINAQDVLKRLKLCGCINIEGQGLNPLQGSSILEQIDISILGKHENRDNNDVKSKISVEAIAPILDSIISANGCSLKYIQFPPKFGMLSARKALVQFQRKYNAMFRTRSRCSHCNVSISEDRLDNFNYLSHSFTCYECLKPFCINSYRNGPHLNLNFCGSCGKDFCQDCVPMVECSHSACSITYCCKDMKACDGCGNATCEDCLHTCRGCNRTRCEDCVPYRQCQGDNCDDKAHCEDCYNGKEYSVKYCDSCMGSDCLECKLEKVKADCKQIALGNSICDSCPADVVPTLFQEIATLREENEELKQQTK